MKKKVILTTIGPNSQAMPGIQLDLYYRKAYFIKHSSKPNLVDIEILTFNNSEKIENIITRIKESKTDIIGFSCYVWNILSILKIVKTIKKHKPGTKIILGGAEVSPRAYSLMKTHRSIDAIVIGEGERIFKELLEKWTCNKMDISGIKGIAYRRKEKIILTKKREKLREIEYVYVITLQIINTVK